MQELDAAPINAYRKVEPRPAPSFPKSPLARAPAVHAPLVMQPESRPTGYALGNVALAPETSPEATMLDRASVVTAQPAPRAFAHAPSLETQAVPRVSPPTFHDKVIPIKDAPPKRRDEIRTQVNLDGEAKKCSPKYS